jgi:hypothetical protein
MLHIISIIFIKKQGFDMAIKFKKPNCFFLKRQTTTKPTTIKKKTTK